MSAPTRKDWILWGALGCALVSTAHAEYTLAVAVGAHPWVALAVPGALDLYVIRALLLRRDVFLAVLVMVAANVSSYLVHSGDVLVDWRLRSAVGALAPLILWRVHSLKYTRNRSELLLGTPVLDGPGAMSAPVPAPEYAPITQPECTLSEPFLRDLDAVCSECGGRWGGHPGVQRKRAEHEAKYALEAPGYVPEAWMEHEYPATYPAPLHTVPDLPTEYVTSAQPLRDSDHEYLPVAREYVHSVGTGTVRGLMKYASIGQDRAGRLLDHLDAEHEEEEES